MLASELPIQSVLATVEPPIKDPSEKGTISHKGHFVMSQK